MRFFPIPKCPSLTIGTTVTLTSKKEDTWNASTGDTTRPGFPMYFSLGPIGFRVFQTPAPFRETKQRTLPIIWHNEEISRVHLSRSFRGPKESFASRIQATILRMIIELCTCIIRRWFQCQRYESPLETSLYRMLPHFAYILGATVLGQILSVC